MNTLVPPGMTVVHVRSGPAAGAAVETVLREEKYYWTGLHEPHVQQAIQEELRPGDVFWDIGAHIGFMSVLAARTIGARGAVVAFEPVPANRERLMRNVQLNRLTNVQIEPVAMSAEAGNFVLSSQGSSLMWTLVRPNSGTQGIPVRCSTIDLMLDHLPRPNLVKIDAEKAELDVLRGAHDLIAERVTTFIVEFMAEELLQEARKLMPGYRFRSLGSNHWIIKPKSARERG